MRTLLYLLAAIAMIFTITNIVNAKPKVASLHPLMTDLAKQVGGDHLEVIELIDKHADPHHFNPSPKVLLKAKGASLYLASGKGIETYLDKLRSTLGSSAVVLEVGRTIPSQKISAHDSQFICCPTHSHEAIDPHWWHDVSNMKKAARVVAKSFGEIDPQNAKAYKKNAAIYSKRLDVLHSWIKREVSRIPVKSRVLATAHSAFGYFCNKYKFKALPIKGISANQETSAAYQAQAIQEIKKNSVKAIFPEQRANPKSLKIIAAETGVRLGGTLIADGSSNYESMMQSNVTTIVSALTR